MNNIASLNKEKIKIIFNHKHALIDNKASLNKNEKTLTPFKKKLNLLGAYFSKPSNIILVIFAIILTLTVVIPLIYLLLNTFLIHTGEASLGKIGSLTFNHWFEVLFKSKIYFRL